MQLRRARVSLVWLGVGTSKPRSAPVRVTRPSARQPDPVPHKAVHRPTTRINPHRCRESRTFEDMTGGREYSCHGQADLLPADVPNDQSPLEWDWMQLWRAADKIVYSRSLDAVSSARTRIERDFD